MYKTGYDPNAYVTFFEKILADEKRRPGSIPKIFSTHPPTPERIQNAQKEIETILPSRPDYIVTTSEFDTVKARLYAYEHRNKIKDGGPGKPTLRSKTEQKTGQTGTGTGTQGTDDGAPTLKKRTDGNNGSNNGTTTVASTTDAARNSSYSKEGVRFGRPLIFSNDYCRSSEI